MAARNRPRVQKDDDAQEERTVWNQISGDLKKIKPINNKAAELAAQIQELEEKMAKSDPTLAEMDALQVLYREGVKVAEQELSMIRDDPNGVIHTLEILTALRSASEVDTSRAAAAAVPFKSRNTKRKFDDTATSSAAESPTQSSSILPASVATPGGPAHARLKGASGRSASVPVAPKEIKDTSVLKTDEALVNASVDNAATPNKAGTTEKTGALLRVGAEVAYRNNKHKGLDGEFIQCTILSISGEGPKKRYEIQDPEPDDNGNPGQIYKASAAYLFPIPPPAVLSSSLPDFPKGKQVLARYPETTTFYKAEVMGMKKTAAGYFCRLRFEGEEEKDREVEVERRYVLDVGSKGW